MIAIVGLGNPGQDYDGTRHNAGFLTVDKLADQWGANYWKDECGAQVAHVKNPFDVNNVDEILLIKPQAFMNLSGGPVKNVIDKYKIPIENLIVIHDDLDIQPSMIRVKRGGSSGGHNGLKSIDNKLTTNQYNRIRIGIGHPPGQMPVADYVLQCPRSSAKDEFEDGIKLAAEATIYLLNNTLEDAQQQFNKKSID